MELLNLLRPKNDLIIRDKVFTKDKGYKITVNKNLKIGLNKGNIGIIDLGVLPTAALSIFNEF